MCGWMNLFPGFGITKVEPILFWKCPIVEIIVYVYLSTTHCDLDLKQNYH